jgi:hypothetical protein
VKRAHDEELGRIQSTNRDAGLRFEVGEAGRDLSPEQIAAFRGRIEGAYSGDSAAAETGQRALLFLAKTASPDTQRRLLRIGSILADRKIEAAKIANSKSPGGAGLPTVNLSNFGGAVGRRGYAAARALGDDLGPRKTFGTKDPLGDELKLNDEIRTWLSVVTRGSASLSGGAPARVIAPAEALDILSNVAAIMDAPETEE